MFEEFNNLDNQTPHPWTIGQEDLYDINFQVINELETNETNTFIDDNMKKQIHHSNLVLIQIIWEKKEK